MIIPNKELFPDWELFVYDLEVYHNSFINHIKLEDGSYRSFEVRDGVNDLKEMLQFMSGKRKIYIGFNSLSYDDMVIKYIRYKLERNVKIEAQNIFNFSDALIGHMKVKWWYAHHKKNYPDKEEDAIWRMANYDSNNKPQWYWDVWKVETPWARSIDIFKIKKQDGSLKERMAKASWYRLQDLPYEPGTILKPNEIKEVFDYGKNDVEFTTESFNNEQAQLYNRLLLEEQYSGLDVLSQHDAGVAERTILYLYEQETGITKKEINKIKKPSNVITVKHILSDKFEITDPELKKMYEYWSGVVGHAMTKVQFDTWEKKRIKSEFKKSWFEDYDNMLPSGKYTNDMKVPVAWALSYPFTMSDLNLKVGAGGLHSVDKHMTFTENETHCLIDIDIESHYPRVLLLNEIKPARFKDIYLNIVEKIVDTRIELKRSGQKKKAGGFKIVINSGPYGKTGDEFSPLYDPNARLEICIEGQLVLLYLIQELQKSNLRVVSANTDGICCLIKKTDIDLFRSIYHTWEKATGYLMEETFYKAYHRRDVNNYIAVFESGEVKCKGAYGAPKGIAPIVSHSVREQLINNVPLEDTINSSNDIRDFLYWFHANRDWDMHHGDIKQQQTVRWYVKRDEGDTIFKSKLKEKGLSIITVPNSENSVLMNDIEEGYFPEDINRQYYIDNAYDLINGVIDG